MLFGSFVSLVASMYKVVCGAVQPPIMLMGPESESGFGSTGISGYHQTHEAKEDASQLLHYHPRVQISFSLPVYLHCGHGAPSFPPSTPSPNYIQHVGDLRVSRNRLDLARLRWRLKLPFVNGDRRASIVHVDTVISPLPTKLVTDHFSRYDEGASYGWSGRSALVQVTMLGKTNFADAGAAQGGGVSITFRRVPYPSSTVIYHI